MPLHEWLDDHLGFLPVLRRPAVGRPAALLTAGIVLAIMILPIITAISREVFAQTPRLHEEAALALGATRWEMIRMSVFPYARSGMVSAVMLGLGRALGETMAVAMVLSAVAGRDPEPDLQHQPGDDRLQHRLELQGGRRPPSWHVLIATGLVLFAVTFVVNFAARWIVGRSERRMAR